jgi:hypothetical protein
VIFEKDTLEIWFKNGERDSIDPIREENVWERGRMLIAVADSGHLYTFSLDEIERYQWYEEFERGFMKEKCE